MKIEVLQNIMGANEAIARRNRELLDRYRVLAIDLMSSPGAGKTSLLEATIKALEGKVSIGVIEGDLATNLDSERIKKTGARVIQINTGGGCSLDANMVSLALEKFPLEGLEILFIENVGNLICPAGNPLGEHRRVVILSLPEGDDKPAKYPVMFAGADCVVLNEIDLTPHLEFDKMTVRRTITGLNPKAKIFELSAKTGEGLGPWCSWLITQRRKQFK
ncbi:MAG: hydrogenase nickel incorporation protein HypB [Dehalococcoidia bacterium]|nr:hydrogenase nickel incorporation protein HypB [Dehalococcoidia bacterium]